MSEKSSIVIVHGLELCTIGEGITSDPSPGPATPGRSSDTFGMPPVDGPDTAAEPAEGPYTLSSTAGAGGTDGAAGGAAGADGTAGSGAPARSLHGPLLRHHSPSVITDTPPRPYPTAALGGDATHRAPPARVPPPPITGRRPPTVRAPPYLRTARATSAPTVRAPD
ncbi:hypothetical protein [Kitasatospora sp. NPDC089509]|uniref:hypothetical protein n=1 Tax=Kitasatospora sp. NPDC089509 TaxID=3364079 RepID=UPI00382ECA42